MGTRIPLMRGEGTILIPGNQEAVDFINTMKYGQEYAADILSLRNTEFHRKVFKYLKLCFDYWTPNKYFTEDEQAILKKFGEFLIRHGVSEEAGKHLLIEFVKAENLERAGQPREKSFDVFRDEMTVKAGYFQEFQGIGGVIRRPKSWAYKNMSQAMFEELFNKLRVVCWETILSQQFESMEQADAVAMQMMEFD